MCISDQKGLLRRLKGDGEQKPAVVGVISPSAGLLDASPSMIKIPKRDNQPAIALEKGSESSCSRTHFLVRHNPAGFSEVWVPVSGKQMIEVPMRQDYEIDPARCKVCRLCALVKYKWPASIEIQLSFIRLVIQTHETRLSNVVYLEV